MPATSGSRTRSIIGRAWQPSTTRSAAAVMPRCASAATATAAPCAPSPTACCRWPAPCSNSRPCSTPPTKFTRPPAREHAVHIPLFDRKRPSLRPDLPPGRAPRAAAVKDVAANAAAPAEPAQNVLYKGSTLLPLPRRPCITGCRAGLPPRSFSLDHWWEVLFLQQRVRRNRWLGNACGAGTMLHGAPTVHLGIKHFQGPAAGVGWQRAHDVII